MAILDFFSRQETAKSTPAINLNQIRVASPCPARWEDMSGDDRVRHCDECHLNVYNLSAMTMTEISELVRAREGRLCVRFHRRADGTMITQDCPRGLRAAAGRAARRVAKMAAAVLSALVSTMASVNAAPAGRKPQPQVCTAPPRSHQSRPGIELRVFDPQGALLSNARVVLQDKEGKIAFSGATSDEGELNLSGISPGSYTLTVSAPGFSSYRSPVTLQSDKLISVNLQLKIAPARVEVEVRAEAAAVQGTMGIVTLTTSHGLPPAAPGSGQRAPARQ